MAVRIISRTGKRHGWQGRVMRQKETGKYASKIFSDCDNGGSRGAKKAALEWELQNACERTTAKARKYKELLGNDGEDCGVQRRLIYGAPYWVVTYLINGNSKRTKQFSVAKYGENEAYRLARVFRRVWELHDLSQKDADFLEALQKTEKEPLSEPMNPPEGFSRQDIDPTYEEALMKTIQDRAGEALQVIKLFEAKEITSKNASKMLRISSKEFLEKVRKHKKNG